VLDPGDKIVDCPPTFTMYEFDAAVNGALVIKGTTTTTTTKPYPTKWGRLHGSNYAIVFIIIPFAMSDVYNLCALFNSSKEARFQLECGTNNRGY